MLGAADEALGQERAPALIGFHSFTGCDQTAKFYGKSKLVCWKTFAKSPPNVIQASSTLGVIDCGLNSIVDGLSLFIPNLYCPSRSQNVTDILSLRWHMYAKLQVQSDLLPPTPSALDFKVKGSYLISKICS